MDRRKKRFNSKARQSGTTKHSKTSTLKEERIDESDVLSPELKGAEYISDKGNALVVIPGKGTQESKKDGGRTGQIALKSGRKLSKKQRKTLEKIVDQKKKKLERKGLLEELSKVQVASEELAQYSSASSIGQIHGKRKFASVDAPIASKVNISSLKGKKRGKRERLRRKLAKLEEIENREEGGEEQLSESDSTSSDSEGDAVIDSVPNGKSTISEERSESTTNDEIKEAHVEQEKKGIAFSEPTKDADSSIKPTVSKDLVVCQPAVHVALQRKSEIQEARLLLPILAEEQQIMETIQENQITILCGETGSGKTTQVPQFLYEAGYSSSSANPGLIGVTEPRRVAAISMSKRVGEEMNLSPRIVSYQIRYEGNVTDETKVKFMTDGVLLKEIESDFLVSKYSVIIIDEAHERSVFTDILIGLLSRIVPLRNKRNNPLKLIIMSATLRIEDFTENKRLFPAVPPLIKVDSRQYPVTVHFNKRTSSAYLEDAFKKACKIHRTLKLGGILIFVTGQNEVHSLCRRLQRTFPLREEKEKPDSNEKEANSCTNKVEKGHEEERTTTSSNFPDYDLDRYSALPAFDPYHQLEGDEGSDDDFDLSEDEESNELLKGLAGPYPEAPMYVLPLYSLLSSSKQAKVFQHPPEGSRLCVVATNVAETSLTIPGVTYVIDTGRVKRKLYDKVTGVSSFRITWTSKASANQRAGRAGRVEPGHCYRLYSSAVFQNEFEDFSEPEIRRRPVEDLLLQMKYILARGWRDWSDEIKTHFLNFTHDRAWVSIKVINFPFPTPPDADALRISENLLLDLGALEKKKTQKGGMVPVVTELGKTLARIPVAPRYSKMISMAHQKGCMQYMITIVAALTVREIFTDDIGILNELSDGTKENAKKKRMLITQARRKWAGEGLSALLGDLMVILRAVGACEYSGCSEKFCADNGLRYKAMIEIRKLRTQLTNAVNSVIKGSECFVDAKMKPPTPEQATMIRQIVLGSLGDQVARKITSPTTDPKLKNAYQSCALEDPVFIHPSSSLFNKLPEYIVYQEIHETTKMYMKGVTAIDPLWLPICAPQKCRFSKPLETPAPSYDEEKGCVKCHMSFTYGPHIWSLPVQELEYPSSLDRFKWFGKFLLEGKVLKQLLEFVPFLLTPASVMIKSWSKLQPKTEVMLNALVKENVYDADRLKSVLKANPNYLLREYKEWIPESKHSSLISMWPPSH